MTKFESEHVAMAEMLWDTLYKLNTCDPSATGARELTWYYTDSAAFDLDKVSPYTHVQEALNYALRHLTENEEQAEKLRWLLAANGENVAWNLRVLRNEIAFEKKEREEYAAEDQAYFASQPNTDYAGAFPVE